MEAMLCDWHEGAERGIPVDGVAGLTVEVLSRGMSASCLSTAQRSVRSKQGRVKGVKVDRQARGSM